MNTDGKTNPSPDRLRVILIGRNPGFTLVRICLLVALVFLLRAYVVLPVRMQGISMLPTYPAWGVNFVNRLAYHRSDPQRGDVVAIRTAGESVMYLKRIIGLPGESVEFRHGQVFINEQPLIEPYLKKPCHWEMPPTPVGPEEYFVVGDNRSMSQEDHTHGRTQRRRIVGRVLL